MIPVTKPFLPPLADLFPYLESMWETRVLSNGGPFHAELEAKLSDLLGLPHVSLFCNATIALIAAQQALGIKGKVITTPYSFVATAHSLHWMGNEPVFVDIDPRTLTVDPRKIEEAICEETSAILPLHCYGNSCDVAEIQRIADKHDLRVLYDACHSFGIEDSGGSVLRYGDMSVVSFHATKVFHTFEGGLLVSPNAEMKKKVDELKNFGFVNEVSVVEAGINGKMSEFNAAVGLCQLKYFREVVERRGNVSSIYRSRVAAMRGVKCLPPTPHIRHNFAYFPVFIDEGCPVERDTVYNALKENGVYARRYFFPLISEFDMYNKVPSANPRSLPVATAVSRAVICLPLYPDLPLADAHKICDIIQRIVDQR